jgi:hypothetical protein
MPELYAIALKAPKTVLHALLQANKSHIYPQALGVTVALRMGIVHTAFSDDASTH